MLAVANHLWQSTLWAGGIWALSWALRNNRAAVRYGLWLAASVKFLIPFSLFVTIGSHLEWRNAGATGEPPWSVVLDNLGSPFAAPVPLPHEATSTAPSLIPPLLFGIWLCGFAASILFWLRCWTRTRALRQHATPLPLHLPIPAMSCPSNIEPGVFGICRPVLLLPEGIADRLSPPQLDAIVAHEMCHVRRRDNLTGAVHLAVEALFWFHPLVWWIRARLLEERERACDEAVLQSGNAPQTYAEAILRICQLYMEQPLVNVSGVTGSNLRKRIEAIMANRIPARVNAIAKAAMGLAGAAAVVIPTMIGTLNAPKLIAQSADTPRAKFEVASVKPCTLDPSPGGGRGGNGSLGDPGMFRTPCATVRFLIQTAYVRYANGEARPASQLKNQPIEGGPDWIDTQRFVIDAKPETPQAKPIMGGPMLQSLLEERFRLKIHRVTRKVPAYALVVAKGGLKLQATREGGCTPGEPDGPPAPLVPGQPLPCGFIDGDETGIRAVGVPVASLCQIIKTRVHRVVLDETGLNGLFDYHLNFNVPPPGLREADDPDGFGLATTELRKLGLELKSTTGDAEIVVIDHIERPTRN